MLKSMSIPLAPGSWSATTISTRAQHGIGPDDPLPPPPEVPVPDPPSSDFNPYPEETGEYSSSGTVASSTPPSDPAGSDLQPDPVIAAATYNLYTPNSLTDRRADLTKLFKIPGISALAVQEVTADISPDLATQAAAVGWQSYNPTIPGDTDPSTTAILWKTSEWTFIRKGYYRISEKDDITTQPPYPIYQDAMYLVWVRLSHKQTGRFWTFCSVALVVDPRSSYKRTVMWGRQIAAVVEFSKLFTGSRLVMMGDFQQPPESGGFRHLRERGSVPNAPAVASVSEDHNYGWSRNATVVKANYVGTGYKAPTRPVKLEYRA
jgi:hypothetical protein